MLACIAQVLRAHLTRTCFECNGKTVMKLQMILNMSNAYEMITGPIKDICSNQGFNMTTRFFQPLYRVIRFLGCTLSPSEMSRINLGPIGVKASAIAGKQLPAKALTTMSENWNATCLVALPAFPW